MAAVDTQNPTSEITDNISANIDENRNDCKTRSSENADISANGNEEEDADESDVEGKKEEAKEEQEKCVFGVKKITDIKIQDGTRFYKVQWADTWEPEYNLLGCKELINEFLEKRKKEKGKSIEEDESVHKEGYCLRDKSVVNKKKRKGHGWSAKRWNKKRRRPLNTSLSADVSEYSGQSDNSEDDGNSVTSQSGILSPQDMKNVQSRKRLSQKRKKTNNLINGINDFDDNTSELTSPMDDSSQVDVSQSLGDDDNPSTQTISPVEEARTVAMSEGGTLTTVTTVISTCTFTTTPTVTTSYSGDVTSWQKKTKWRPILLGGDSDEEGTSELNAVKIKEEPISDNETKEEEELFKRAAKLKASFVIRKLYETKQVFSADESEDGSDNDESYCPRPSSNELASPNEDQLSDDDIGIVKSTKSLTAVDRSPDKTTTSKKQLQAIPLEEINEQNAGFVDMVPPPFAYNQPGIGSRLTFINRGVPPHVAPIFRHEPALRAPHRHMIPPIPLIDPSRMSHFTFHGMPRPPDNFGLRPQRPPLSYVRHTGNEQNIMQPLPPDDTIGSKENGSRDGDTTTNPIDLDKDEVSSGKSTPQTTDHSKLIENNSNAPLFQPNFSNIQAKTPNAESTQMLQNSLQCNIPIKFIQNECVEVLLTRILFYLVKFIKDMFLEPGQLKPDKVQELIAKGAVLTIKESYKLGDAEPNFVETQINDLTQIALKHLPYERLMGMLYTYAVRNVTLNQTLRRDRKVLRTNFRTVPPKQTSSSEVVTSPSTVVNTQNTEVPVIPPIRSIVPPIPIVPPVMNRGPLPMAVPPPVGMFLPSFPRAIPPPGFPHAAPFLPHPMVERVRMPYNYMLPCPGVQGNEMRQMMSPIHPSNRLRNPSPVHGLPHTGITHIPEASRMPYSLATASPSPNTPSVSGGTTANISTSGTVSCSITEGRSSKVTQADVKPTIECIDALFDSSSRTNSSADPTAIRAVSSTTETTFASAQSNATSIEGDFDEGCRTIKEEVTF